MSTNSETLEELLARIDGEERELVFPQFDEDVSWRLGCLMRSEAERQGLPLAMDIRLPGRPLFGCSMAGLVADHVEWIRRKSNVTLRFSRASFAIGRKMAALGPAAPAERGLDLADYALFGGSFPIRLSSGLFIGAVTVTGLPEEDDHNFVVGALRSFLAG